MLQRAAPAPRQTAASPRIQCAKLPATRQTMFQPEPLQVGFWTPKVSGDAFFKAYASNSLNLLTVIGRSMDRRHMALRAVYVPRGQ